MDNTAIFIITIFAFFIYLMYRSSHKRVKDFTKSDSFDVQNIKRPFPQNGDKKPSEFIIESNLGPEKYHLYKTIKKGLKNIGTPDLLWKGQENGWVLSLLEGNGSFGSVILVKEKLIGKMGITKNQLYGMSTDERFPTVFSEKISSNLLSNITFMSGMYFEEVVIDTKEKALGFVSLIELNKYYNNYY